MAVLSRLMYDIPRHINTANCDFDTIACNIDSITCDTIHPIFVEKIRAEKSTTMNFILGWKWREIPLTDIAIHCYPAVSTSCSFGRPLPCYYSIKYDAASNNLCISLSLSNDIMVMIFMDIYSARLQLFPVPVRQKPL